MFTRTQPQKENTGIEEVRKLTMSATGYTAYAMDVRESVNTVMSAGYEAIAEKKKRGAQIYDITQMVAILRLQCAKSAGTKITPEVRAGLRPPETPLKNPASTDVYFAYIKDGLIDAKDHLLHMHKELQRLRLTLNTVHAKLRDQPPEEEDPHPVRVSQWDDDAALGKILGELDLSEEELKALK
jgi:hypothetical protein